MEKKIVSFDAKAAKAKAVATVRAKAQAAASAALEKGIALSERQLTALRNAKKRLA